MPNTIKRNKSDENKNTLHQAWNDATLHNAVDIWIPLSYKRKTDDHENKEIRGCEGCKTFDIKVSSMRIKTTEYGQQSLGAILFTAEGLWFHDIFTAIYFPAGNLSFLSES